jgi:hypothetical protein
MLFHLHSPAARCHPSSTPRRLIAATALCGIFAVCGCILFRPHIHQEYFYFNAKQCILRVRCGGDSIGQRTYSDAE